MTLFRIIDCETTGMDDDSRVVEIASLDIPSASPTPCNLQQTLVNPQCAIPPEVMAIHHITNDMVNDAPLFGHVHDRFMGADYYVAHNARFDQKYLGSFGKPWICTYKCALVAWPDAPSHSNAALYYWLLQQSGKPQMPPACEGGHHRALFDVHMTAGVFMALIKEKQYGIQRMIDITAQPAILPKINFGKHRGTKFADLAIDYLQWMSGQAFDEDVMHTVKQELARREK